MNVKISYQKSPVNVERLEQEIRSSDIVMALDYIDFTAPDALDIFFKSTLPVGDKSRLDTLVAAHTGEPLPSTVPVPIDSDSSPIMRVKTTRVGWHYEPRAISFITAKAGSLHNKNSADVDLGDAAIKFYNAAKEELVKGELTDEAFQELLATDCVWTHVDFEPQYDMDIIGGVLMVKTSPADPTFVWIVAAPDIPAQYGGSIPFSNGGLDVSFLKTQGYLEFNGRGVKTVTYNGTTHQGKFRAIVKHVAGVQVPLQIIYQHFKG